MVKDAPKLDKSKLVNPLSTKFLDKDGTFSMNTVLKNRTHVTYEQIPKVVEMYSLATGTHVSMIIMELILNELQKQLWKMSLEVSDLKGGSTITQQVVKNYFLTMDKTAKRKVQEWYLSYKLEQQYSKHEILEMYLNND
ncbi:biosynthetic peptidoglycan transglycosylase [Bacillus cereus]